MNLQPYQEESNRLRKAEALPADIAKGAIGLAGSSALANKILPLLNQHIPVNIMQKGLSKLSPKLGAFMEQAQDMGFDIDQVRDFLKDKVGGSKKDQQGSQNPPKPPGKQSNPLQDFETNYPELARGLMNTIQQGQPPQAAAAVIKNSSALKKQVAQLEKETGKNFVDYVLELFGPQQQAQGQQQPQQQPTPQQPQGQQGGTDPELMKLLQNLQSGIQNMRKKGG
jgi:DNA-binding transcriptional MerR regulator